MGFPQQSTILMWVIEILGGWDRVGFYNKVPISILTAIGWGEGFSQLSLVSGLMSCGRTIGCPKCPKCMWAIEVGGRGVGFHNEVP